MTVRRSISRAREALRFHRQTREKAMITFSGTVLPAWEANMTFNTRKEAFWNPNTLLF